MTGGRPRSQGGTVGVTRAAYGAVRAVYIGYGAMPDHVRELLVGEIRRRASGGAISLNHLGAVSFRQYGTPQIPRSERALTRCTLMPAPNAVLTAPLECIGTPVFSSFNHTRARVRIGRLSRLPFHYFIDLERFSYLNGIDVEPSKPSGLSCKRA